MDTRRASLFFAAAGLLLLGLGASLQLPNRASAQTATSGGDIAAVACTTNTPNWTDCTVTLNGGIGADGTFAASLPTGSIAPAYCDDGYPLGTDCAIAGNTVVYSCPAGCPAGTQFVESVLGTYGSALTQKFSFAVSGGSTLVESPHSAGFGLLPATEPQDGS